MLPFRMNPASPLRWSEYEFFRGAPSLKAASGLYPGQKGYEMGVAGKFDFGTGRTYTLLPHVEIVPVQESARMGADGPESDTKGSIRLGIPKGSTDVTMRDFDTIAVKLDEDSHVMLHMGRAPGDGQAWHADGFLEIMAFFPPPNSDGFREAKEWLEWFAKTYYRG